MRAKIGKAETKDVKESGSSINLASRKEKIHKKNQKIIKRAKFMAMGMNMKIQDIHQLNKQITAKTKLSNKKANTAKLQACNRDSEEKVGAAKARYTKGLDKLKKVISLSKEQSQLAKRSLQLCE